MDFPEEIKNIVGKLNEAGYKAYLVGGCVRDLLLGAEPKDWDVATNAKPEEVQAVFPDSVYENDFGTVLVKLKPRTDADSPRWISKYSTGQAQNDAENSQHKSVSSPRKSVSVVEITTFRIEGRYTDKRHPDEIKFAKSIEEDLSRRDFTVNAMAIDVVNVVNDVGEASVKNPRLQRAQRYNERSDTTAITFALIDPYGGQDDLKNKIIRTVGDPNERFGEDALRLMRAVRFAVQLDFQIEFNTRRAILKNAGLLEAIAKERIRDEFQKIIMSDRATAGILLLEELDLLRYVVPELREGLGVGQNKHHIYTVFEHNIRALDYTAKKNYSLEVRMASLLHDVGKPRVKGGDGPNSTFYGHEVVGAKMSVKILDKLHFPKDFVEKVGHLVRYHLFYYNVGEVTEAGVRRFLRRVGTENINDLIRVREADRIGSGVPKAVPYKLRHLLFMIEKVKHDPISPKMLKINGTDIMELLKITPGPKVGQILNVLLEEVLDNPAMNTPEALALEAKRLSLLEGSELIKLSQGAKETKEEFEAGAEAEIKKKFHV